jgi:hypothetical protein
MIWTISAIKDLHLAKSLIVPFQKAKLYLLDPIPITQLQKRF